MEVYIIVDQNRFLKSDIVKIIRDEGYKHNFIFGGKFNDEDTKKYMGKCNEIWCFGKCENTREYMLAKDLGVEIWQMG